MNQQSNEQTFEAEFQAELERELETIRRAWWWNGVEVMRGDLVWVNTPWAMGVENNHNQIGGYK